MIKLSQMEQAFKMTASRSTPHREPDFDVLRSLTGEDDPEVRLSLVFIEEHNTGYPGVLERYLCSTGEKKVSFQIDLLPGFIQTDKPPVVQS